jgi:hypothetical protein
MLEATFFATPGSWVSSLALAVFRLMIAAIGIDWMTPTSLGLLPAAMKINQSARATAAGAMNQTKA